MDSATPWTPTAPLHTGTPSAAPSHAAKTYAHRSPKVTFLLTLLFLSPLLLPSLRANDRLVASFFGVAGLLALWQTLLWAGAVRSARSLTISFVPVKSHYIQACVQTVIMLYWGWFAPDVYRQVPLIAAQIVFVYILEALLTWSRGRTWRLGFGPVPIVLSTNLLLWFKPDWFAFQFVMLALGAAAKQFITWNRDGRRTHIFNPSAFGQFLVALVLIATGTTNELTFGKQIAASFESPHMLIVIFLGGVVVQRFFHVTLMTLAAVLTVTLINLLYTKWTGTYYFVNINLAAPIFLGMHLLITDPATSPRTPLGRVLFGAAYGVAYAVLFRLLALLEIPTFWDKLLPVPLLNLCVPLLDRIASGRRLGVLNRAWESLLAPRRLNLVHMAVWIAAFATMWTTGFVDAPHPGDSIPFWKQALREGKPFAGHALVMAAGAQAEAGRSGAAYNELGLICVEGSVPQVKPDSAKAAGFFANACALGNREGCANVAAQFLFLDQRLSDEEVTRALDFLEQDCLATADWKSCFLTAVALENGNRHAADLPLAFRYYVRSGMGNLYACKGMARVALKQPDAPYDLKLPAYVLEVACARNDVESCWYLAFLHRAGRGVPRDEHKAAGFLARSCHLGMRSACPAPNQRDWPPYTPPRMAVPGWSTAFPLAE